jgi:erythronate-4-phosphate dehydrogenase
VNILYDDNMPYAQQYFAHLGNAQAFSAGNLSDEALLNCEALLVRSTTKVDAQLLKKAPKLRYLATATAGFNHFSLPDIEAENIHWYNAGGCNARAVAEYILAALYVLAERQGFALQEKTVAVVGAGNVGRALLAMLNALDMKTIVYDPPRAQRESEFISANFEQVLQADIISLHVPLIKGTEYPTEHMFNESVLAQLNKHQILINACRGEVLDNQALLHRMENLKDQMPTVALDCWENEPTVDTNLLPHLTFATAHIAGHSIEGKAKGTDMVYQDLCRFLGRTPKHHLSDFLPAYEWQMPDVLKEGENHQALSTQTMVSQCIKSMYDIANDDSFFRRYMAKSESFSEIRRHYHVRREWPAARIAIKHKKAADILRKLGFRLANDSE